MLNEHGKELKTDVSQFEKVCRASNLKPVKKLNVGPYILLIADGYQLDHPDFRGPHWRTLWAAGTDENNLKVARPLYFGIDRIVSQDTRVAAAEKDGTDYIKEAHARSLARSH